MATAAAAGCGEEHVDRPKRSARWHGPARGIACRNGQDPPGRTKPWRHEDWLNFLPQ